MKSLAAAAITLAALATPARAQPGKVEPQKVDTVDEDIAVALSLGGTVVSWVVVLGAGNSENVGLGLAGLAGTLFAPSFGHWYSHATFTRGLGVRALGLAASLVGLTMVFDDLYEDHGDDENALGGVLMLVGAGMYLAGTVDDIANAGAAARKHNARFQDLTLLPTVTGHGGGFALGGRF